MTEKKYPDVIYCNDYNIGEMNAAERAYDLGYRDGRFKERLEALNPLAGWSNLTEAIQAGERIEWDALDGIEAKCVHPELGTLTHKMERNPNWDLPVMNRWYLDSAYRAVWAEAFTSSWDGDNDWSLWVKGDLPLRKQTADELEPGTGFRARYTKGDYVHTYARAQAAQLGSEPRVICFNEHFSRIIGNYDPAEVEVMEVYGVGTFEKSEGDA